MSLDTYLSEYVHYIIVQCGQKQNTNHIPTDKYITPELTYDWLKIGEIFEGLTDDFDILNQPESWYSSKAEVVWDIIHLAGSVVEEATDFQRQKLFQMCEWMSDHNDFKQYYSWSSKSDPDVLLALLQMTAAFERSVGNVYSLMNQPVPFLLRDLLKSTELQCLFGKVPILFTQLILGCPKGLNLRNVVWHGFISSGELQPCLVSALIVLFASLGKLLSPDMMISRRPQVTSYDKFCADISQVLPDIKDREEEVFALLSASQYITDNNLKYWRVAYKLFQDKRFGDSVVLLLPQMEHCLRILYCKINSCPARLLTAESTVLYTTLDEILAPSERPVLQKGLLMALLDLTSSLSGPRLRDRLSHGEITLSSLPGWLANHTFCLALATAHHQQQSSCSCDIPLCSELRTATFQYRSRFHVLTNIKSHIRTLLEEWISLQSFSQPPDLVVDPISCHHITALDNLLFHEGGSIANKVLRMKKCLRPIDLDTLYRPKSELDLATTLLSIVNHLAQTAKTLKSTVSSRYELWCGRALRSRARRTVLRMWEVLPDLCTALLSILMIIVVLYHNLSSLTDQRISVSRLLKQVLKAVQNAAVLCDTNRNRWTEVHHILSVVAESCLEWFKSNTKLLLPMNE